MELLIIICTWVIYDALDQIHTVLEEIKDNGRYK